MSETELICAARAGDQDALALLCEHARPRMMRYAIRIMHSRTEAEDCVQDAMVRIVTKISQFKGECAFYTWVHHILFNLCVDAWRRRKAQKFVGNELTVPDHSGVYDSPESFMDLLQDRRPSADQFRMLAAKECMEFVENVLCQMTARQRKIFLARHMTGDTTREIAERLGISEGNVKNALHSAHLKLREALEDTHEETTYFTRNNFVDTAIRDFGPSWQQRDYDGQFHSSQCIE